MLRWRTHNRNMTHQTGISACAPLRLHSAIEKEVRKEFAQKLASTTGYWERINLESQIIAEIKRRLNAVSSPQSLW
jgi:hypothetical protein